MMESLATAVLNVDDDDASRDAKTRILRRARFDVLEAPDGASALRLVASHRPRLVLLEVRLPDMSGNDVCRRIKADPATKRIPVLSISSTPGSDADERLAIESGADIYLVEPLDPGELISVVRTLLRLRETEAGLAESEERLRLATDSAGLGTCDIDLRNGNAVCSAKLWEMLGHSSSGATGDISAWIDRIHPDDLTATMAAFETAERINAPFRHEHRIIRADDGSERWIAPTGRFHPDETGRRTRFIGVMLDVTERRHADAERNDLLARESSARLAAEDAARLNDQFLATLSHELRTPMSAVLGWLHLLRSGKLPRDRHAQALETIERNARLQNQLINDLLDVSRIITGKLAIERERMHPAAVVAAAIEAVNPQASAREIAIRLSPAEEMPFVFGDPNRLQQVVINLLVNAVKFSPPRGEIDVAMRSRANGVEIEVADRGEGIAPDVLPHVFDRFRQADASITRKHGGMGLGLAIARHIVELHEGSVRARSDGPGKGATFAVWLPALHEAATPRGAATPTTAEPANEKRLAGVRALAVDDDPSALGMLASMLELGGAHVICARSADEAIALYEADASVSLLLSDIGMPKRDGYDLVASLRRQFPERAATLAAIAISGYVRDEDHVRSLHAGFDAHLAKPFEMEPLFDLIARVLDERGAIPQANERATRA